MTKRKRDLVTPATREADAIERAEEAQVKADDETERWAEAEKRDQQPLPLLTRWQRFKGWIFYRGGKK